MTEAVQLPSAPEIWPEAEPYWEGAANGVLMLMRCLACEDHYVHPRPFCPHCGSDRTEWREAQGSGTVYTFTVTERAPIFKAPAMVELAEGPIMMTAIVDCEPAQVQIGQPVTVSFCPTAGGAPLPVFRPA